MFFIFLLKTEIVGTRLNRLGKAVLMSTHNLFFFSKIRKIVYTCKPTFYCIKVWFEVVKIIKAYFRDEFLPVHVPLDEWLSV